MYKPAQDIPASLLKQAAYTHGTLDYIVHTELHLEWVRFILNGLVRFIPFVGLFNYLVTPSVALPVVLFPLLPLLP